MEYREIEGVKIPVGQNDEYFGATESEVPEMINPKENGIVKTDSGETLVIFANGAQAIASLFLSGFGLPQLKMLIPQIRNVANNTITKMIQDTCSRVDRKDFIESLDGNMPRQLTISEMVNVVKYVGEPSSRATMMSLEKVLTAIKLDSEHVDSIVAPHKPKAVTKRSKADLQVMIDRTVRSITRTEKKIANIQRKISSLESTEESESRNYRLTKLRFTLEDTESFLVKSKEKLGRLNQLFENAEA